MHASTRPSASRQPRTSTPDRALVLSLSRAIPRQTLETAVDATLDLRLDPWGRLVLTDRQGVSHLGVIPIRAFPISDPAGWISLCDADGRELLSLPGLSALPKETRDLLAQALGSREFVPVIQRVVQVSSHLEPAEWEVETDRGATRFVLKSEDDVRRLGPFSAMIQDAQGVRYRVPDTRRLDAFSRKAIDRYL